MLGFDINFVIYTIAISLYSCTRRYIVLPRPTYKTPINYSMVDSEKGANLAGFLLAKIIRIHL